LIFETEDETAAPPAPTVTVYVVVGFNDVVPVNKPPAPPPPPDTFVLAPDTAPDPPPATTR